MGWNQQTTILTAPISIGDVSRACGRSGSDLGDLIANGTLIAPMAKYKPFKNSNSGFINAAAYTNARKAARYGLGVNLPQLTLASTDASSTLTNDWVYDKPQTGLPNEYFRMLDFDGYASKACAPLAVSVGQLVYDNADSQLLLFLDDKSNAIRTDGKTWVTNQSLSIQELLESGSDYYQQYVAFIIKDKTKTSNSFNLIKTNKTFKNVIDGGGNETFIIRSNGNGKTESGLQYPGIPILSLANSGHDFEIIVCLSTEGAASGYAYSVVTDFSSALTMYSIGFAQNCDRTTAKLGTGEFIMDNTTATLTVTPTLMTSDYEYPASSGQLWNGYALVVSGTFSTTQTAAYTGNKTISGRLSVTNSGSFPFGQTPSGSLSNLDEALSVSLAGNTSGQIRTLFSSTSDPTKYLWVLKNGSSVISTTVTARATFMHPFNDPLVTDPANTIIS